MDFTSTNLRFVAWKKLNPPTRNYGLTYKVHNTIMYKEVISQEINLISIIWSSSSFTIISPRHNSNANLFHFNSYCLLLLLLSHWFCHVSISLTQLSQCPFINSENKIDNEFFFIILYIYLSTYKHLYIKNIIILLIVLLAEKFSDMIWLS